MIPFLIKAIIILNIPLIPLILARGIRWDRIWFSFYLLAFLIAAYLIGSNFLSPYSHLAFFFLFLSFLGKNLSFSSPVNLVKQDNWSLTKIFLALLYLSPFLLPLIFGIDYTFIVETGSFYFVKPWSPSVTLIFLVIALLNLTLSWERWKRISEESKPESFFRLGLLIWWIAFLFFIAQLIYTGDKASLWLFQFFVFLHLLMISLVYFLIFKKSFLAVKIHPSAQFIVSATRSILVLIVLTFFFWIEALSRSKGWSLPNYSLSVISVILLASIILFPALPFGPFKTLQRIFYHHLYLPEQDFALEVSHYLKVMRGEETLERIGEHLRERLPVDAVLIYRLTEKKASYYLWVSCPVTAPFPPSLPQLPQEGSVFNNLTLLKSIPLKTRSEILGYLLLLGKPKKITFEEESLIRFWSETLGLLLHELELKEKQAEQEKLAHFAQASSFLLHDAKNLTQLLDLILKNCQTLPREDLFSFFQDSHPALKQARERAKKILEKLETFQPPSSPVLKFADIKKILEELIKTLTNSLKNPNLAFRFTGENFSWKGDADYLRRTIENLIFNSLQEETPKVEVILQEETGGYHIQVKDWGKGVAEENQSKLFKPFFTTKRGGSGLGLYQAKVLVESLGGKIWYEPNLPHGSIFHVWLTQNPDR